MADSRYLQAMGIDQWVLRNAEPVVAAKSVEHAPALQSVSLPSFPAQTQGKFLIVCAQATAEEGQGSAYVGAAAALLDAMLGATQWPAQECVLLDSVDQLELALPQASIVIALGEVAAQLLCQQGVEKSRQTAYPHRSGATVFSSYHPVLVQSNPKLYKRPTWEDLKLAMAEAVK